MKKLLIFPILALTAMSFNIMEIAPIDLGADIPMGDHKMVNAMNDTRVSINESKKNNGVLVIFSCNTCPYVIAQEDRIRDIQRDALRMQIGVVIINSNEDKRGNEDSKEEMRKYGNNQKYLAPYVIDSMSVVADAFGATRTPECFLFGRDGKLAYRGSIDDSPKEPKAVKQHYLLDAMTAVSKGNAVTIGTSVSSGCTIKRKQAGK
ncbi:MAG: hypothetical protein RL007_2218 [Bacteroidota bacterium]|jgi:thioredoxin-related protein